MGDEAGGDGVGEEIDHLLEDVFVGDQADFAVASGGEEALPAPAEGVEGAGEESIEAVHELRQAGFGVGDAEMEVVGEDHEAMDLNAVGIGGVGQAVVERGRDGRVGAEEVPALDAPAGDEVRRARNDSSRQRHATSCVRRCEGRARRDPLKSKGSDRRNSAARRRPPLSARAGVTAGVTTRAAAVGTGIGE